MSAASCALRVIGYTGLRVAAVLGRLDVAGVAAKGDPATPAPGVQPRCVPRFPGGPTGCRLDLQDWWDH
jgi:hypothetical protein